MRTLPPNLQITNIQTSKPRIAIQQKSKKFCRNWMLALSCVAFFSLIVSNSFAGVITDDFTGHTDGDPLAGTTTPVGNVTWQNSDGDPLLFSAIDGIVRTNTGGGSAIVDLGTIRTGAETYTLSADVNPFELGSGWAQIMFNTGPGGGQLGGQLWMLLNTAGNVGVLANGTGITLVDVPVPGFTEDTMYTLTLSYNVTLNTVNAFVDGFQAVTNYDLGAFNPDPAYAGIGFVTGGSFSAGAGQATNFSVVTSVPEPGSVALIMLAGATLGFRVLRRKRTLIEA